MGLGVVMIYVLQQFQGGGKDGTGVRKTEGGGARGAAATQNRTRFHRRARGGGSLLLRRHSRHTSKNRKAAQRTRAHMRGREGGYVCRTSDE